MGVLSVYAVDMKSAGIPEGYFGGIRETGLLGRPADRILAVSRGNIHHVVLHYDLPEGGTQDDYCVTFELAFDAGFFWSPHVTPEPGHIAEQHVFRTPALIARGGGRTVLLIPDGSTMEVSPVRYYLDMDAGQGLLHAGMSHSVIDGHVLYKKAGGSAYPAGELRFGFYLLLYEEELENPFRPALDFWWSRFGRRDDTGCGNLSAYVSHTYGWAFDRWRDVVWQEFEAQGRTIGAPVFIVTTSQSPNYPGVPREREVRSVWNQAWFCSLRSASGLYRHARRTGSRKLMEYALKTKELALSFPQQHGLFDSVMATGMERFESDGKSYQRSLGWGTRYLGNSDRNPFASEVDRSPRHILDMSFTAYHMLMWYEELERDERLAAYARRYADRLVSLQDEAGYYPAWVDGRGRGMGVLDHSAESAMSAAFLLRCHRLWGREDDRRSALRAVEAILTDIVPQGRWEDFETYWSCSRWWSDRVGQRIPRNQMYKSCNLSMYYTSLALYWAHEITGEERFLRQGRRVLDELLMTQASWQPSFMAIPVLGGFGVMNADAEWNDARQSLFAELIVQYGMALGIREYVERGLAALRASFAMMYCPENPQVKVQWERAWPFLGREDYGFNMENYGHDGRTGDDGSGMGEFTIYDWGNGAAAEGYERMLDHWGRELIEEGRIEFPEPLNKPMES